MERPTRKQIIIIVAMFSGVVIFSATFAAFLNSKTQDDKLVINADIVIPSHWDKDYVESVDGYSILTEMEDIDWNTYAGEYDEVFDTVSISESIATASFEYVADVVTTSKSRTKTDEEIIMLSEDEAWKYISNNIFTTYPSGSFKDNKSKLQKLQSENTEIIEVKCWYWKNPDDVYDMSKITVTKKFAVNSAIASLFEHAFEDIYNHPDKPVINIADKGMGTWVLRGKMHNENRTLSAHSLGCCIDINPSTGSFKVNGTWYGNAYGQKPMPEEIWKELPETHNKYHVLYQGSPIVETFKSYGFVWGGDWTSGTDVMHFSFIGDGSNSRKIGQQNYLERK